MIVAGAFVFHKNILFHSVFYRVVKTQGYVGKGQENYKKKKMERETAYDE